MTRLLSILLLTGFLLQNFSKVIVFVNYEINKEYITKNLCENKSKPQLNCNGKCHLKKEFEKEDKKESSTPIQNLKDKYETQLFSESKTSISFWNTHIIVNHITFNELNKSTTHLLSVFHPPTTC